MINLCLPHVVLEKVLPSLAVHYWMQETKKERLPEEKEALERKIQNAPLVIQAELGRSTMLIKEFLQLQVGDIIELDQSIQEPLQVRVGGKLKFYAQPGKLKNKLAVQVTEVVEEAEEDE